MQSIYTWAFVSSHSWASVDSTNASLFLDSGGGEHVVALFDSLAGKRSSLLVSVRHDT